ncbi:MAG: TIGR00282 family metallophosphoesterase [Candidatus Anammoxibacter sp.]
MKLKILILGDVVGKPGRNIIETKVSSYIERENINFCVANCENAAGGSGITNQIAGDMFSSGVSVITMGDHVWKRKDIFSLLSDERRILRPANYSPDAVGQGSVIIKTAFGKSIGVISLLGRVFMKPIDCPFRQAKQLVKEMSSEADVIIVDIHAEATSEKVAMGWFLDGMVSAVVGTHTHIQTSDETILPGGTAYITDLGMTGPYKSILGRKTENVLKAIVTQMPSHFEVADEDVRACGVTVTIDAETGKADDIQRVVIT